jgi:TRAP-type C4-dicarboxylate transport system permease small subunit
VQALAPAGEVGVMIGKAKKPREERMAKSDAAIGKVLTGVSLVGVGATAVILVATLTNVISRAVFNIALNGAVDLSNVFLVAVAFCALPGVTFYGGHIKVDIVTEKMPPPLRKFFQGFNLAATTAICALTAWYTIGKAIKEITVGSSGSALRIPYYPFYFLISAMFFLTAFCVAYNLVHLIVTGTEIEAELFEREDVEQIGGEEL